ncbi:MAG: 5-(carboxyamino)imidazole ribonucleotide synthase [Pseudomonadota bacterium]
MRDALRRGSTIGILGGGQLGRMLAIAAARLGFHAHIYDPDPAAPAAEVALCHTAHAYDDGDALRAFAEAVDVVTYEFENIPTAALDLIEARRPIHPGRSALATSQDRLTEKLFLTGLGLSTAPFAPVDGPDTLAAAIQTVGAPAILKTRRMGYDGKGQVRLDTADDVEAGLAALRGTPAILEGRVTFDREISVIAARGLDGQIAAYDPGANVHHDGILRTTTVPAPISEARATDAIAIATRILTALDYVGVIGVELFDTASGFVVNEFAPRVHNSGHWTEAGCAIDQFEQHIRAISGWPLGDGTRHTDVTMENLIGADMDRIPELARSGARLHLYGKSKIRPGRKMGHVNRVTGVS